MGCDVIVSLDGEEEGKGRKEEAPRGGGASGQRQKGKARVYFSMFQTTLKVLANHFDCHSNPLGMHPLPTPHRKRLTLGNVLFRPLRPTSSDGAFHPHELLHIIDLIRGQMRRRILVLGQRRLWAKLVSETATKAQYFRHQGKVFLSIPLFEIFDVLRIHFDS